MVDHPLWSDTGAPRNGSFCRAEARGGKGEPREPLPILTLNAVGPLGVGLSPSVRVDAKQHAIG
jgi:hypothetical protein